MKSTKSTGDEGEVVAIKYLQKKGYIILDTNFKFGRFGEIDLIAQQDTTTVFIEIKYRTNTFFGMPEESVTQNKLYKCQKTMEYYCKKNTIDFENIRFDVITILKKPSSYALTHYRNIPI